MTAPGPSPAAAPRAGAAGSGAAVRALAVSALAAVLGLVPVARAADPPRVSAPNAISIELSTGDVAFQRRPDEPRPIASVTKLMTALLALEQRELSARIPAARYGALAVESQIGLRAGERLSMADMLRGLLLGSGNDAAASLAEEVGGSRRAFVRQMNRRAKALGLTQTKFADPIGLSPENRSTARELVTLARELRRFSFFERTVDRSDAILRTGDRRRVVQNRNTLVRQYGFVSGIKTGHTARAGYVLVGSAQRRGVTIVSVVLGTESEAARNADTLALLEQGLASYSRRIAVRRGRVLTRVPIRYRRGAEVGLAARRTMRRVIRRGTARPVARVIDAPAEVEGPIRRGQRLGTAEILVGGRRVDTVELVAAAPVPAAGAGQRAKDYVTRPIGFVLAMSLLAASVWLVLHRRGLRGEGPRSGRRREMEAA